MQPGRDPVVLGFVDFVSPAHAATAMDALQGVLASALIFNLFAFVFWLLNICTFFPLLTEVTIGKLCASIYIFILACLDEKIVYLSFFCVICDVLFGVFTQKWVQTWVHLCLYLFILFFQGVNSDMFQIVN